MVKVKYIAFFIFYMVVAVLLTFRLGPLMVSKAEQINTQPICLSTLVSIKIYTHIANKKDVRVALLFENQNIVLQYYTNEGKHLPLTQLLYKHGLLENENDFPNDLPTTFSKELLQFVASVEVLHKKANDWQSDLKYVAINGTKIKGNIPFFRKKFTTIFGYFICIIGFVSCALVLLSAYNYVKFGTVPRIPNRWEGLKQFVNLFKINKS